MVSRLITYADLQGNRESASSKPAVVERVASKSRAAPRRSTFARASLPNLSFHVSLGRSVRPWLGKFLGIAKIASARAGAAAGTLHTSGQFGTGR